MLIYQSSYNSLFKGGKAINIKQIKFTYILKSVSKAFKKNTKLRVIQCNLLMLEAFISGALGSKPCLDNKVVHL